MTRRYYAPDLPADGGRVDLSAAEAQHAIHVMRVQIGQSITLFDGQGNEALGVVTQISRHACICDAQSPQPVDREPWRTVRLGIALPKPDRARELIERLTELGVESVTPLVAARTQRAPRDPMIEKLRRGVIEACKQCGRNRLLRIEPTRRADEFFADRSETVRLIAHGAAPGAPLDSLRQAKTIVAAVGPEGGWTEDELQLAISCGFAPVNLGQRTYRIETAATVLASVLITARP